MRGNNESREKAEKLNKSHEQAISLETNMREKRHLAEPQSLVIH